MWTQRFLVLSTLWLWACTSTTTSYTGEGDDGKDSPHGLDQTQPLNRPDSPPHLGLHRALPTTLTNSHLSDGVQLDTDHMVTLPQQTSKTRLTTTEGLSVATVDLLLRRVNLPAGGRVDIAIAEGRIQGIIPTDQHTLSAQEERDCSGLWVTPAFIDSHVHLAYLPVHEDLLDNGIAAAVDLASPVDFLARDHGQLRVVTSGPMITARGGYPTRSWGADGYGVQCATTSCVKRAVRELKQSGARLIKVPLGQSPQLGGPELEALVEQAGHEGLRVVAHALNAEAVTLATNIGVDVLAHTPIEPLNDDAVEAWGHRAVISTLAAFGGTPSTVANLAAFRESGALILYGTDLGNTRQPGIQVRELELLLAAGLTGPEIVAAGTSTPARFWQLTDLGRIEIGATASLLLLRENPHLTPLTLAAPTGVIIAGKTRL
jgi:imidazolonepropionase-like amidohydrolase